MKDMNIRCQESPVIRKSGESERRLMTFVASDGTRDSYGTVLNMEGWDLERFNKNGVIGYQHKVHGSWADTANPDNIIGKGHAYIETDEAGEKRLLVDVEFEPEGMNELADKVYKKLEFGTLKAVSVGFMPVGKGSFGQGEEAVGKSHETYYFAGQELLEVSVVNVPANPNALKRSADQPDELEALRQEALAELEAEKQQKSDEDEAQRAQQEQLLQTRQAEANKAITIARAALL